MSRLHRTVLGAAVVAAVAAGPAWAHDWNEKAIAWQPYEAGLAAAKKAKKPILLVVFTEWCPHCRNYAKVFHDPRVVEASKKFVMIHVDQERQPDVAKRWAPDGQYIPRTFFLSPDGNLDESIHAPREKYRWFWDERDPAGILAGMAAAEKKLR